MSLSARLYYKKINSRENDTMCAFSESRFSADLAPVQIQRATPVPDIQPKLSISQPGDPYEQEADRVADQVMRMPDVAIQRSAGEDESEEEQQLISSTEADEEQIQRAADPSAQKPEDDEQQLVLPTDDEDLAVQRYADSSQTSEVAPQTEAGIAALHNGGQPLDPKTRAFMEPRFGFNFSQVRVHTDGQAAQSAAAVSALAYTVGQDVVFGSGQYQPGTDAGRRLMAHELTHVVQQSAQQASQFTMSRVQDNGPIRAASGPRMSSTLLQRSEEGREGLGENSESEGGDAAVVLDITCSLMPDSWVIGSIRASFSFYPRAKKHLDHYLSGAGGEYEEDVAALFRDNPRIAERIGHLIRQNGSQSGGFYGTGPSGDGVRAPIHQDDYDSTNWRLSLGNVDEVNYEVLEEPDTNGKAPVQISIRDPYEWHPAEDRGTQCIHEVMERQKTEGKARDFTSVGSATVTLKVYSPKSVPSDNAVPNQESQM